MASKTEIANLSLSHLGIGKEIANIETDKGEEASACRRFFDILNNTQLRDFPWQFTTKTADGQLIEEDPTDEWAYSYRYPSDCALFRRIQSGIRNDSRQSRVPYRIVYDATGRLIYTDQENAIFEYVKKEQNVELFSDDYVLALSLKMAFYMAPRLTAGDPFKLGDRAARLYEIEISKAKAQARNEEQPEEEPQSEFIRARE